MKINSILINSFRNYESVQLKFNSRLNFFIGENGEGKTNLLEAIQMFSTLKSFRDNTDDEILNWDKDTYYLKAEIQNADDVDEFEIGFTKLGTKKKKIKLNEKEINRKLDFIGNFITITLSPIDLKIIDGGPAERRKFIDSFLSIYNREYLINLLEYNKILKHRNALLKSQAKSEVELVTWDNLLVEKGIFLISERIGVIASLNEIYRENLKILSGEKDIFEIIYNPNVNSEESFRDKLQKRKHLDLKLGYTTVGPHRDNLFIGKDSKDITEFGSQGQKRSSVIAMKTAQFKHIKKIRNQTPVLLIDDVIRELDIKRRNYFLELLMESGQSFFTTTDLDGLDDFLKNFRNQISIFEINKGKVKENHYEFV